MIRRGLSAALGARAGVTAAVACVAAAALMGGAVALAQPAAPPSPRVVPPFPGDAKGARKAMATFLERLARPPEDVAAPGSRLDWDAVRGERARQLRAALGVPAAIGCRVESVGALDSAGLRIEKLLFWSAPGVPVPAHLHLPVASAARPAPLVLLLHGHFDAGKSHASVQARAREMATAGLAVLVVDRWGFEERRFTKHRTAHELFAADTTLLGLDVRDVECALEALAGRADLDLSRVAAVGESGGGTLAAYLAAIDDRIAAVAAVSALHDVRGELVQGECPCNYVPRQLSFADTPDVFAAIAPRPLLVAIGVKDKHVDTKVARRASARVAETYAAVGAADRFTVHEEETGHATGPTTRRAIVSFLARELGVEGAEAAPASTAEPLQAAQLACLRAGPPDAEWLTLADVAAAGQRALVGAARDLGASERAAGLATTLGIQPATLELTRLSPVESRGLRLTPLRLRTEPELQLAGVVVEKPGAAARDTWLWLDPRGGRTALSDPLVVALAERGHRVVLGDLRCQGEHPGGRQDATLYLIGEMAGRPLLGQRLQDAMGWLLVARGWDDDVPLRVVGHGESGLLAVLLTCGLGAAQADFVMTIGAPLSLVAEPGRDPRWGLPATASVWGLSRLGDLPEFAGLGSTPLLWIAPRLRDGRAARADDPAWRRMASARNGVSVEAESADVLARLLAAAGGDPPPD